MVGIALEVKKQMELQANIKLRLVMNNAFKSFKSAIYDMINDSSFIPGALKLVVKKILQFTGWHITPGKEYKHAGPYQCHIQHLGDNTLVTSSLSGKVAKYRNEIASGKTDSKKRSCIKDECLEEYKKDRDILDKMHYVRVNEGSKQRLAKKFGLNKFGSVNAHFADLCELELLNGQSVYEGYVNEYLERSNAYITKHPQASYDEVKENLRKIHFLTSDDSVVITREEAEEFGVVIDSLTNLGDNDSRKGFDKTTPKVL